MSEEVSGALPSLISLMASVDVKPKVSFFSMLVSKSSRDCVSEEVSGALPSLISLMVSVDAKKPYVPLLCVLTRWDFLSLSVWTVVAQSACV